jgi:hypothetical protein
VEEKGRHDVEREDGEVSLTDVDDNEQNAGRLDIGPRRHHRAVAAIRGRRRGAIAEGERLAAVDAAPGQPA